jgi:hypothetical protein
MRDQWANMNGKGKQKIVVKVHAPNGYRDPTGIQLNNGDYFNFGFLDQGYWPDGIYAAPTDEAFKSDVLMTKDLGFNAIRKHWKIELARWYYYCDKTGLLVWQDFPGVIRSFWIREKVHWKWREALDLKWFSSWS